jgi:hypothetical protein
MVDRSPTNLGIVERAFDEAVEPVQDARTADGHKLDCALIARLESNRGPGRNIQPHAVRTRAIKVEGAVRLEKVEVRTDLNRPITAILDRYANGRPSVIQRNRKALEKIFAGNHERYRIG